MSSIISSIKKNESIFNKQLLLIDSDNRNINETETSFTNVVEMTDRITKVEILNCDIPNTLYNINNDNTLLNVDVQLLNGNIVNEKLIVSDSEIQNNNILSTNIKNGSVANHNYISSSFLKMTDIKTKKLNIYTLGEFKNESVYFYGSDNINPVSILSEINDPNNVFCVCYNIDHTFIWRIKITGNILYSKMETVDNAIYISVKSTTPIKIYDINDVFIVEKGIYDGINSYISIYVIKFDTFGKYEYSFGIRDNKDMLFNVVEQSDFLFISSAFNNNLICYNKDDTIALDENIVGSNTGYVSVYKNGFFITYTYLDSSGSIDFKINSISIQKNQLFISIDNTNDLSIDNTGNIINFIGICIIEYKFNNNILSYIGNIEIGGSNGDNTSVITSDSNNLYIIGNFTSNPLVFYKPDGTLDDVLRSPILSNKNIFFTIYPLDFIQQNKGLYSKILLTSSDSLIPSDIKVNEIIYISCNFINNMKFYDNNGYVQAQDINNLSTDEISQCIVSYNKEGNFIERFYNNNSSTGNLIDINSNKLYSIGSFLDINNYYNTSNSIDLILLSKETVNGILVSYTNSLTGYILNYDILDNTTIFKSLVSDEMGYFLNINTFAENLGFENSQKFIPTIFGNKILWQNLNINSTNDKLKFNFLIGNSDTFNFDEFELTIIIPINRYATYTPYNLIYELNKSFNKIKVDTPYLNQEFNAFYYDKNKQLFYIRIDINGTFSIYENDLSNSSGMNLQLIPYISPFVVISDVIGNVNKTITDNSELELKLTDNIITEVVNNTSFSETCTGVKSGSLILTAGTPNSLSNIYAETGIVADNLNNINVGDYITFNLSFIKYNYQTISIDFWNSIDISNDGIYQTVVSNLGNAFRTSDSGNTWNYINLIGEFKSVSLSATGQYQTIVGENTTVFISNDFGVSWNTSDNIRNWSSVAISSTGQIQSACVSFVGIFQSYNYGISWTLGLSFNGRISSIAMSANGLIQTAVVVGGNIWHYNSTTKIWEVNTPAGSVKNWSSVAMSADGLIQTAVVGGGDIWHYNSNTEIWEVNTSAGSSQSWASVAMSADGLIQTTVERGGYIWHYNHTTEIWEENTSTGSIQDWTSIAISADGLIQTAVAYTGRSDIWYYNYTTEIWEENNSNIPISWVYTAMSADGLIQTAVERNGYIWHYNYITRIWEENTSTGSVQNWSSIAMSADGLIQTAVVDGGDIWHYNSNTEIWEVNTSAGSTQEWISVAMSADGLIQTAVVNGGDIWHYNSNTEIWEINTSVGSTQEWISVAMSADGLIQTALPRVGFIWQYNSTTEIWEVNNSAGFFIGWASVAMSADGLTQSAAVSNGGNIWNYNPNNNIWEKDLGAGVKNWTSIAMSGDGLIKTALTDGGNIWYYNSTTDDWVEGDLPNVQWKTISMSSDGLTQSIISIEGDLWMNFFTNVDIMLNVKFVSQNRIIFNENISDIPRYELLNNLDMGFGYNFTIRSIINSGVETLFIKPGNYTIDKFIEQVNKQIHEINPLFWYSDNGLNVEPFTYNKNTKKITFNPYYLGQEENIIKITTLLQSLGFTELPDNILKPIVGQNIVNRNFSGSNNLFIKSNILGINMKEHTISTNPKFNNIIATLGYNTTNDSYTLVDSNKNEIYLSKKILLDKIDIKIIDNNAEIVNLNGGRVAINLKLVKS